MKNILIITDNQAIFIGSTGFEYIWCKDTEDTALNQFQMIELYNSRIPFAPAHPITSIIYI